MLTKKIAIWPSDYSRFIVIMLQHNLQAVVFSDSLTEQKFVLTQPKPPGPFPAITMFKKSQWPQMELITNVKRLLRECWECRPPEHPLLRLRSLN